MGRLRLKNPIAQDPAHGDIENVLVDVAVDVPAPHLDGLYTYRVPRGSVAVGSVVKVPFGTGSTEGFVVSIQEDHGGDPRIKRVQQIVESQGLFDEVSLSRYQRIATLYGASLHNVIALATSSWKPSRRKTPPKEEPVVEQSPSVADREFIAKVFGNQWRKESESHLLIPPGILWERIAASIFLSEPVATLILVPTERHLERLRTALIGRDLSDFITFSSSLPKSERSSQFQRLLDRQPLLLIGTRIAALAPFTAQRVIVVDPGDENFVERHSPYFRVDSPDIWSGQVITLSYGRDLPTLARGVEFIRGKNLGKHTFATTTPETLIKDLSVRIKGLTSPAILISYNDKSFSSALLCATCRNRSVCQCGFPLHIKQRNATASCRKCLRTYQQYQCRFCGGNRLMATKVGGEALATSIAKSIKHSRVIVSTADSPKDDIMRAVQSIGTTVVIATHGLEPRILDPQGRSRGYDLIVILGARAAFASPSLARSDRFRLACSRLLGLINPGSGSILVDIDPMHPELLELRSDANGRGVERVLSERLELGLPPYSTLFELYGEDRVLQRLRTTLLADELFKRAENTVFPAHDGSMMLKVVTKDRQECIRLLVELSRVRSAKRLPRVSFRVEPEDY